MRGRTWLRGVRSSSTPMTGAAARSTPTSSRVSRRAVAARSGASSLQRPPGSARCPDQRASFRSARGGGGGVGGGGPPPGRGGEIGVLFAPAAPRQRQMPGPAVVLPLGAANEEDAVGLGSEDDGHGGARPVRIALETGRPSGEPGGELGNPAQ